ncbi:MAG: TrmH family RNA methyltransferase [Acidimicrobiales bacterium]
MSPSLSFRHQRVQRLRRLLQRSRVRHAEGVFVIEGEKLLSVAIDVGAEVEGVYVAEDARLSDALKQLVERAADAGVRVHGLGPGVLARVAATVTPQPVLAVVRMPSCSLEDLRGTDFLVVCVDVRDPGNAGAVIRAADAAGAKGVICCEGTVDPYNPKTVRASAGSVLRMPVVSGGDPRTVLVELGRFGIPRLGAVAHGGVPFTECSIGSAVALVLGNEASGLPHAIGDSLDGLVTVPMSGGTESLNVSMAAAVLCFEVARRRPNLQRDECTSEGAKGAAAAV